MPWRPYAERATLLTEYANVSVFLVGDVVHRYHTSHQ